MAGGGVGEAMLLGAAMGGGSAAITGGDPLKGALLGGITGGVGGGISNLAGASAGITPAATETAAANVMAQQPIQQATQQALTNQGLLQSGLDIGGFNPATMTPATTTAAAPGTFTEGMAKFANNPLASIKDNPFTAGAAGIAGALGGRQTPNLPGEYDGPLKRFRFNPDTYRPAVYAEGGITDLAAGGYERLVGENPTYQALASGGVSSLGSYSDGGRMLKGPGDGMSDSIPASISGKRPARLADGEFVVPADVVSHLGNGSTDAGAKQLYAMMDKVRTARTGRKSQGREINPRKYMPA
jgi:hypothetical protein